MEKLFSIRTNIVIKADTRVEAISAIQETLDYINEEHEATGEGYHLDYTISD